MKVILLQDVKSLGKKGAMVEVSEGYARNFIIPKKLGLEVTPAPRIVRTLLSFFARYIAVSPGIAPVLMALRRLADMYASGCPVSTSFNVAMSMDLGRPLCEFLPFEPYHFSPHI